MCKLQSIHKESFVKYGEVVEFPEEEKGDFHVVMADPAEPWRLAVFRYSNKEVSRLEAHPYSYESFEPLEGVTVLLVAPKETPADYEAFILDKPVCLNKGIWHQVLSLTDSAQVKITENYEVSSIFHDLEKAVSVRVL